MPELPEVEITRQGLEPHLIGHRICRAIVHNPNLRMQVTPELDRLIAGCDIQGVTRRGKYLLIHCGSGTLIIHLGMSGSLRILKAGIPRHIHDHFDLLLDNGMVMRLRDPRRFGVVLWTASNPLFHPLLKELGPEPFNPSFTGKWLYAQTRNRRSSIKQVLMDSRVVAGVGNIYANEALFRAAINPRTSACRIGEERYVRLADSLRTTLTLSIKAGGSSLRDFVGADGNPGYFQQQYLVYGKEGSSCPRCSTPLKKIRQGQRSTFYCPQCQT